MGITEAGAEIRADANFRLEGAILPNRHSGLAAGRAA
jgi:hypothetical protein